MVAVTPLSHSIHVPVTLQIPPPTVTLSFLALHAWKWLRKTNRIMASEMAFKGSFLSASSPALSGCSFNAFDISHERP